MAVKPLLAFNLSITLFILGLSGAIFLAVLGIAHLKEVTQFTAKLTSEQQGDAVRACFVSAAIYAALAVVSASQIFLHKRFTDSIATNERNLSIELMNLQANEEGNAKPSTPLTRPGSVSSGLEKDVKG